MEQAGAALILAMFLAFLPAIAAPSGRGGGNRATVTMICLISMVAVFINLLVGVAIWAIAWIFALMGYGSARRYRQQNELLAEVRKLREGQVASRPSPATSTAQQQIDQPAWRKWPGD